ncbi:MAG TPA: PEP-CTERM sorting domain-containing protein [Verrucomicrobiae bacterium]|nr:PEP-CTERM sorting domain-containing protein [Verrucomicrobiae bacterium]
MFSANSGIPIPAPHSMTMMKNSFKPLFLSALAIWFTEISQLVFADSHSTVAGADAFVAAGPSDNLADNNYGGGGALAIAAPGLPNGEFQSVLKFDLSGARSAFDSRYGAGGWFVQSVSLQLSSSPHSNAIYNDVAAGLFSISLMQNNSWVEGTGNASSPAANGVTFNSLHSTFIGAADQPLGTFSFDGKTSGINNYSLQLTPDLISDIDSGGIVSVRAFAADNTVSYLFSSRAGTPASVQPQLVITAVPEPGTLAIFGLGIGMLLLCVRLEKRM